MPEVEDPTAQCDGYGVRPVSRSELAKDVLNMSLDRPGCGAKVVANFLVAKAIGDVDQNLRFATGQSDFREILNELL